MSISNPLKPHWLLCYPRLPLLVQISNLSWGSATPYSTSTGLVGKVSLGSVTITRPVDANSPKFFGMMASGVSFSRIDILSFPGGSISPATLPSSLGLHLGRALITSINSTWGDDGTITETIVFNVSLVQPFSCPRLAFLFFLFIFLSLFHDSINRLLRCTMS